MTVNYEIDGAVGVVTLAKPPHNLLDDALLKDLMTAYVRHFCAGMDDLPILEMDLGKRTSDLRTQFDAVDR
jgi:hypothetical protein